MIIHVYQKYRKYKALASSPLKASDPQLPTLRIFLWTWIKPTLNRNTLAISQDGFLRNAI